MKAEQVAEHRWLDKFVGEWKSVADMQMAPDSPVVHIEGTETVRSLGGVWIVGEGSSPTPGGGDMTSVITLGFDTATGRFRGTWIGTMMNHMWVYEGTLDTATNTLTLDTTGPDMGASGEIRPFQDRYQFLTDDHRVLSAYQQGKDGSWQPLMEVHYHRVA